MASLENIFKGLGNSIKQGLVSRGITVADNAGFTTIMGKILTLIDTKTDESDFEDYQQEVSNVLDTKVNKVTGKELSTNDFTNTLKTKLDGIEEQANNYDDTEVRGYISDLEGDVEDINDALDGKQATLVSGTNIKTINNNSLLGEGNLTVITDISGKQDVLKDTGTGANFHTINNQSLLGSGNLQVQAPLTEGTDYLNKTHLDSTYQEKGNYAHLVNGQVPASELPSFVDDVIEGYYYEGKFYQEAAHTHEIEGETGKIYVDITDSSNVKTYRYSGTAFVAITSGNVVVVDTVADGNMNAVTSNAVYDEIYTTVIGSGFEAYMEA